MSRKIIYTTMGVIIGTTIGLFIIAFDASRPQELGHGNTGDLLGILLIPVLLISIFAIPIMIGAKAGSSLAKYIDKREEAKKKS